MAEVPPPRASPEFPGPRDDDAPITGVYPASRDFVREVNRSGLFKVSWAMLAWVGFIGAGSITGYRVMAAEARDAGLAVTVPLEKRVTVLEQQTPQLREEIFEARKDMRELQNVIVTRRRSERLDEPLAPPQAPDAGVQKRAK